MLKIDSLVIMVIRVINTCTYIVHLTAPLVVNYNTATKLQYSNISILHYCYFCQQLISTWSNYP